MIKIPEDEIRRRMQKLHNFEKIKYPQLKERSDKLREKVKVLETENKIIPELKKQIETLQLELEELKAMKFGKRRNNPKITAQKLPSGVENKKSEKKKKKRTAESFRRPEPLESEVTDTLRLEVETCPECGESLENKKEHIHFREDLEKAQERLKTVKRIIKTIVETGICKNKNCNLFGKKVLGGEIPSQKVIIGENLRQMVVFLTVIQGQSYSEVEKSLAELYDYKISSGQIANILEGESRLLTPYYNHLIEELETESKTIGAHYDETVFKTKSQGKEISDGNYCWVKIGTKSQNQLIWFGKSRGKQVAEDLRNEKKGSIGISDDYGSYKNLFDQHQLCWAHPHRKLRDLAESGKLSGRTKKVCQKAFKDFQKLYKKARKEREKALREDLTEEKKQKEQKKLENLFDKITQKNELDPEKLARIRQTLKDRKLKYFTFFQNPQVPLDNNKAERAIRKIVIRRKKSLGCKSPKGADVLSILYSVIFSLTENNPQDNFFDLYELAANFDVK